MSEPITLPEPLASPDLSTPWIPLWPLAPARLGELAYAATIDAPSISVTSSGTAITLGTAPALTFDGLTPVMVEFVTPLATAPQGVAAEVIVELWDGGTALAIIGRLRTETAGANAASTINGAMRITPTAGVHTFSVRGYVSSGVGAVAAGFIRISLAAPLLSAPPGAAVAVQYGTSLPTSPLDGQEAILVDSLTNPSYQWRFRYNAGSTSPYKWEFVGGSWAFAVAPGGASTALNFSTGWADLDGPAITVPRPGDYSVRMSCNANNDTVAMGPMLNVRAAPALPSDSNLVYFRTSAAAYYQPLARNCRITAASAGDVIRMIYACFSGGTSTFDRRVLEVQPVRVS